MLKRFALLTLAALFSAVLFSQDEHTSLKMSTDSLSQAIADSEYLPSDTIISLTEEDFKEVAQRLGVEVAAIKAVVDIEAGRSHQGFTAPGKPLINFDLTMFRRFATRRGVNLSRYNKSHSVVFTSSRGSQDKAHRRLNAAMTINPHAAIEGTFWGMFQIGGFNWKKCGAESLEAFAKKMAHSERAQLDMFANFITNSGLLQALKDKNWAKFARGYNGPGYARRGYHTRMAQAYARHLKEENDAAKTDEQPETKK
ncbi:MAG: N-acetylmuramidase family protein [Bacteroides sp.]|nr:N-acetylmuramidase family protein [Bacteroides sp.]